MSSTTRISNYPSVSVGALETALNYFRLAPELDETTLENLAPKVSPKLLDRVKSALNTQLPLTRLFVYQQEEGQGSKRQRTERLPHSEETLVEKRWRALLACNPHGSDADEQLKRRARVATVESLFFNNSQLIESNPYFGITASYLDIRDLCRLGATSTMFNHLTSQDSLWKGLSKTLSLGKDFWPEQTKGRVRKNYQMLGRICRAFHHCCSNEISRRGLKDLTEDPLLLDDTASWGANRRAFFSKTVKPLISPIYDVENEGDEALDEFNHRFPDLFHCLNQTLDYPLSITDMFFASCAHDNGFATELFNQLVEEYRKKCRSLQTCDVLQPLEDPLADCMERLIKYFTYLGVDLDVFWDFLGTFSWMTPSRFVPIVQRLMEKGAPVDPETLILIANEGFLELFESMVTKYTTALVVAVSENPLRMDFAAVIIALSTSRRSLTAEQILRLIDLFQAHIRPNPPLWNGVLSRFHESFGDKHLELGCLDSFLAIAQYRNDALMQKVISLGLKPINDVKNNSLQKVLDNFDDSIRNPDHHPDFQTLVFMMKYGAKISPEKVLEFIEKNPKISLEVKVALKRLFGLTGVENE